MAFQQVPTMDNAHPPGIAEPPRRGLIARAIHLGSSWSRFVLGALPVVIGLTMVGLVVHEATNDSIEFTPIGVPAGFADHGLTPDVVAARLVDAINETATQTLSETLHRPSTELENATPDLNLPVVGLSLHSLASLTRKLLGWPERRLSGEVTQSGDTLRLRLRLTGRGVIADVAAPASDGVDRLLVLAAPQVWRSVSPRLYAWHVAQLDIEEAEIRDRLFELRRRVQDPDTWSSLTYLLARSLVRSGQAEDALAMMDELVRDHPRYAAAHYGRAQALEALQQPQEALAAQQRGLNLDPDSPWAHLLSAGLLRQLGRYDEALAEARKAQDLDDDDRPGLVEESNVLREMSRPAEAADRARRALALDPHHAPALAALGAALLRLNQNEAALAAFEQALHEMPQLPAALAGRSAALHALGRE